MTEKVKPLLRGHFHQVSFFIALGACSVLLASLPDKSVFLMTLVYSVSLCTMFGVSALYHRINWKPAERLWWRRLDHCAIFILIAGTGTPISLLAVGGEHGQRLLAVFWSSALAGVLKELLWIGAPKWVSAILFVLMGWAGVLYYDEMAMGLGPVGMFLALAGGVVYTIGALIYALKKPDPFPRTFGYHEIFHILVSLAGILHFSAVFRLVTKA